MVLIFGYFISRSFLVNLKLNYNSTTYEKTIRAIKDTMYVKHIDAGFLADKDGKEYPEMVSGITKDLTSAEIKQMKNHIIKTIRNDMSTGELSNTYYRKRIYIANHICSLIYPKTTKYTKLGNR